MRWGWLLMALACTGQVLPDESVEGPTNVRSVGELYAAGAVPGQYVVQPLVVMSGPTADGLRTYVQDPATGQGLEVRLGGYVPSWPPAVGTQVSLRAYVQGQVAFIDGEADVTVVDQGVPLVVADAPDDPRAFQLVRYQDVGVVTDPDPAGRADLDIGLSLDGRFGTALPFRGNRGTLTAVVTEDQGLALRDTSDWQGSWEPGVVLDITLRDLLAGRVALGATVRLSASMATPWSLDGQTTLLQAPGGLGIWLEREGFEHPQASKNEAGLWTGQVRWRGGAWYVRSWWPVEIVGRTPTLRAEGLAHGVVVDLEVSGLGPVDAYGDRTTEQGWVLDGRFMALDDLPDPVVVRAAVDGTLGQVRLAVFTTVAGPE